MFVVLGHHSIGHSGAVVCNFKPIFLDEII